MASIVAPSAMSKGLDQSRRRGARTSETKGCDRADHLDPITPTESSCLRRTVVACRYRSGSAIEFQHRQRVSQLGHFPWRSRDRTRAFDSRFALRRYSRPLLAGPDLLLLAPRHQKQPSKTP